MYLIIIVLFLVLTTEGTSTVKWHSCASNSTSTSTIYCNVTVNNVQLVTKEQTFSNATTDFITSFKPDGFNNYIEINKTTLSGEKEALFFLSNCQVPSKSKWKIEAEGTDLDSRMDIFFVESNLTFGDIKDHFPYCPTSRFFTLHVDQSDFARNITFKLNYFNTRTEKDIYNKIIVKHGNCPTEEDYDYISDVAKPPGEDAFYFDMGPIFKSGTYYVELKCGKTAPIDSSDLPVEFGFSIVDTCNVTCFQNGDCQVRKIGSRDTYACVCDSIHAGENCTELYQGYYTLIIVASLMSIAIMAYVSYQLFQYGKYRRYNKLGLNT